MTNTTDKPVKAVARIAAKGELQVASSPTYDVIIPANSEKRAFFTVRARKAVGQGGVTVDVEAMGEHFVEKIDMTVRPPTSLLKSSGAGEVAVGDAQKLDLQQGYLQSSVGAKLVLSKAPTVGLLANLDYLVGYPHGCVEQTTSKAFPQLYFKDMMALTGRASNADSDPDYNVREAIKKLQAMQRYNGGLSYWLGGNYESWWGSVYAAHFLYEAKRKGFDVDDAFLNKLYGYIQQKTQTRVDEDYYYYNETGAKQMRQIAPRETVYSLYILALAGRPDRASMSYYKDRPEKLSLDMRYMLACAYQRIGDEASYKQTLPAKFEGERAVQAFGGSFSSYIRDQAIALNTLIETDPANAQIPEMARRLTEQMNAARYLNTQERAFGMLALGKLAAESAGSAVTAVIKADGKRIGFYDGKKASITLGEEVAGKQITVEPSGNGYLYYFWEVEGVSPVGKYTEEDKFLRVRREFYDRKGNRIYGSAAFKQNQLVVVKITLESEGEQVENVVVTDMLPAGFEVENPRIGAVPGMSWVKDASFPDHFDFRDDRVNFFATATDKQKSYYYAVRCVSPGQFQIGPVSADAMYNGAYHSYNGGGKIVVK